jgi:hypothetical protein
MPQMASATTLESQPGNSIGRIASVIYSPVETFASIAKKPTWLAPVILACIVSIALFAVFGKKVGWQRAVQLNIQNNALAARQMDSLTPEQRQASIAAQAKIFPYFFYGAALIGAFLFTLILAAIFLGLFKLGYGAQLDLKLSMAIVSYAFVPRLIYALLGIFVLFVKDPSQVDIQNLVASNPGALMSTETARWLVVLATQFDFFTLWIMILLALGFHAASPKKISTFGAFAGIFAMWAVWVIVLVGFTAAVS